MYLVVRGEKGELTLEKVLKNGGLGLLWKTKKDPIAWLHNMSFYIWSLSAGENFVSSKNIITG